MRSMRIFRHRWSDGADKELIVVDLDWVKSWSRVPDNRDFVGIDLSPINDNESLANGGKILAKSVWGKYTYIVVRPRETGATNVEILRNFGAV